jgi:hypothetical protein
MVWKSLEKVLTPVKVKGVVLTIHLSANRERS